jgi:hypothetical protein
MEIRQASRGRIAAAAFLALGVAACDEPQQTRPASLMGGLPPQVCAQAKASLDRIASTRAFEYDATASATIEERVWLGLGEQGRNGVAQTLAVHGACNAKEPPATQQIMIRNEDGRTLADRIVEIAPGQEAFLSE